MLTGAEQKIIQKKVHRKQYKPPVFEAYGNKDYPSLSSVYQKPQHHVIYPFIAV
jgi:hypothetical protein